MHRLLQNFTHCGQNRYCFVIRWVFLIILLEKWSNFRQFSNRSKTSRLNGEVKQRRQSWDDYINKSQQFFLLSIFQHLNQLALNTSISILKVQCSCQNCLPYPIFLTFIWNEIEWQKKRRDPSTPPPKFFLVCRAELRRNSISFQKRLPPNTPHPLKIWISRCVT